MLPTPACPRCGGAVAPPDAHSVSWRCPLHGAIAPLYPLAAVTVDEIDDVLMRARVPVWVPSPSPIGWSVNGLAWAGDDSSAGCATALACSGPAPLGGMADLILVAEEPGTGLGAGYAALPGPDPGAMPTGPPHAVVRAGGHATPLWSLRTRPDRCVFVGEAAGVWLWAVLWPASAGVMFVEDLLLQDLREHVPGDLSFGGSSAYLRPGSSDRA